MKRGERKKWRELALMCTNVADSQDYAQEYMTKVEVGRKLDEIVEIVHGKGFHMTRVKGVTR